MVSTTDAVRKPAAALPSISGCFPVTKIAARCTRRGASVPVQLMSANREMADPHCVVAVSLIPENKGTEIRE
jgi:hypothetical protein